MNRTLRNIFILVAIALALYFLYLISNILIYVLVAGLISSVAHPLVALLKKLQVGKVGIPSWLNAMISILLLHAVIVGLAWIIVPQVLEQAEVIQNLDLESGQKAVAEPLDKIYFQLKDAELIDGEHANSLQFLKSQVDAFFNAASVKSIFGGLFGALGNIIVAWFSVIFISFFFIKEDGMFKRLILILVPSNNKESVETVYERTLQLLSRYFIGLAVQITAIATLVSTGLSVLGVPNALLIGFLAGMINVIPYLGPLLGFMFGFVIATLGNFGIADPLALGHLWGMVVLVFAAVQLLDNLVFQPFIFSNSVRAHPLEIFLVISVAGTVGGVGLMIVAIPFYTFLRISAKEFFGEFRIVNH